MVSLKYGTHRHGLSSTWHTQTWSLLNMAHTDMVSLNTQTLSLLNMAHTDMVSLQHGTHRHGLS